MRLGQAPDFSVQVSKYVGVGETGNRAAFIDITADHRNPFAVAVLGNRQNFARHFASAGRIEAVIPFHHIPSKVAALGDEIDFLPAILSTVAADQTSSAEFERNSPGIP